MSHHDGTSTRGPAITARLRAAQAALAPFLGFLGRTGWQRRHQRPDHADFVFGNPQETALPGLIEAFRRHAVPAAGDKEWFAYKSNEPGPRRVVADSLRRTHAIDVAPEDVLLTNGTFASLAVILSSLVEPGDEVVFISPPWFFYEPLIHFYGGRPVRVPIDRQTLGLDLAAIDAAIGPRTRAVIINSPNNPTGAIYPPATLAALGALLSAASAQHGRDILLISDEAYSRVVYDSRTFTSPTAHYPHSFIVYTYGKTLLAPGQRIGYIALPPTMPDRAIMREALELGQYLCGYAFPNALLQHALADLEALSIDVAHLERKRDRLAGALRDQGYTLHIPEATFYLLVDAPIADDAAFAQTLDAAGVYVLPGSCVELPGAFRLSLTASDAMIERALPHFAAARAAARELE